MSNTTTRTPAANRKRPKQADVERACRLMLCEFDFIHSPEFDTTDAAEEILACDESGRLPGEDTQGRLPKRPAGIPAYFATLYETPLLTPEQERRAFRLLNFCKYQANALRSTIDPDAPDREVMDRIEHLSQRALETRNALATANLRLVVSIARRFSNSADHFDELVGEGNMTLFDAINKFDYGRGFRFSTYATHAVQRRFYRMSLSAQTESSRVTSVPGELLAETLADEPTDEPTMDQPGIVRQLLAESTDELQDRERDILSARFGLNGPNAPQSLKDIAAEIGLSKERVRQIQWKAIDKLRDLAIARGFVSESDFDLAV